MQTASRPPLRRLLALDHMIRSGKYPNATSAGKALEVHPRTIHRDFDFLRNSWGAPLEFCPKHNGFYYAEPDFALPMMRMSEGELVALFLAERLLQEYGGTPYSGQIASLFRKITAALPEEVTVDLNHLERAYSFRQQKITTQDAKLFGKLARAVQNGLQLELSYWTASRNELSRRRVDPYHLVSVQGDWYLVGYCHLREEVRMFAPSRIRSCKETGTRIERPDDFRIEEYLDHSFRTFRGDGKPIKVRLRFAPTIASYIQEKQWHPSQEFIPRKDGTLLMTLKVSHLLEMKRWVMSYGSECEVLEPVELRTEIEAEIEKLRKLYQ